MPKAGNTFASMPSGRGVILLGGTHSSLAIARSLKRTGAPVGFITDGNPLTGRSRYIRSAWRWAGPNDDAAVEVLLDLARRHGFEGSALVAAGDAEVRFAAQHHDRLSTVFRMTLQPWDALQWSADKTLAYRRAAELGLHIPHDYAVRSLADLKTVDLNFPVVLKPSMRVVENAFTRDKAWRADDLGSFQHMFARAAALVGEQNIVVQELVPGGSETQLSYAGLWNHGKPAAWFTAQRTRQYPLEFSHTSTLVETLDAPDVVEAAHTFLTSTGHHGLVEVEFKRDSRDGKLKLLDVNPRPWSWFALSEAAGLRLGEMLLAVAYGDAIPPAGAATTGIAWMYVPRDVFASVRLMLKGMLSPFAYLASFANVRAWGIFDSKDPVPALLDVPIGLTRKIKRMLAGH
jgi:D-aspartate ligase